MIFWPVVVLIFSFIIDVHVRDEYRITLIPIEKKIWIIHFCDEIDCITVTYLAYHYSLYMVLWFN